MTAPLTSSQRQRLRSPANLWRALIPLLVIVGLLVLFTWPRGQRSDGIHVIDVAGPIAAARQESGFAVQAPAGLSAQWRPTSTDFNPSGPSAGATFRIGYVTPSDKYAELFEGDDVPAAVAAQYGPLSRNGSVTVNGVAWALYSTNNGRPLLMHTTGKVTVIVSGNAAQAELVQLAGSLKG